MLCENRDQEEEHLPQSDNRETLLAKPKISQVQVFLEPQQNTPFHLAIEEPLAHAKSSQAMRSMALSFGKLIGMAETNNYEVQRVAVHKWQKRILGKISRGTSKQVAFEKAEERVPDEQWLKNSRCRVPHDGMVDAFLIARYFWETKKN